MKNSDYCSQMLKQECVNAPLTDHSTFITCDGVEQTGISYLLPANDQTLLSSKAISRFNYFVAYDLVWRLRVQIVMLYIVYYTNTYFGIFCFCSFIIKSIFRRLGWKSRG